jgi:hypothetical protein
MSTKRARVITVAAAGTLTLATVISVAGVTLSTSTAAAGTADAYLTSDNGSAAAVRAAHFDNGSTSTQQMAIFSKTRAMQAEHQQEAAAEKAAAVKAAAAKAAAVKAAKAKAAKAKAAAKADAARTAKARAAANAAVKARAASVTTPSGSPQQIAQQMLGQYGWSSSQFSCLSPLWGHESGWNVSAQNSSSGAYGIPQALPGSQMASAGGDWQTNAATQIKWGLTYIQSRYGSPCGAWAHEQSAGWY